MSTPTSETADLSPLHQRIAEVFEHELAMEVPTVTTDLFETGIVDSLAFVTLLVQLEQHFGLSIAIDDLELENFRSIEKIAEFVSRHRTARHP